MTETAILQDESLLVNEDEIALESWETVSQSLPKSYVASKPSISEPDVDLAEVQSSYSEFTITPTDCLAR